MPPSRIVEYGNFDTTAGRRKEVRLAERVTALRAVEPT
jgi:hypothetical protein